MILIGTLLAVKFEYMLYAFTNLIAFQIMNKNDEQLPDPTNNDVIR